MRIKGSLCPCHSTHRATGQHGSWSLASLRNTLLVAASISAIYKPAQITSVCCPRCEVHTVEKQLREQVTSPSSSWGFSHHQLSSLNPMFPSLNTCFNYHKQKSNSDGGQPGALWLCRKGWPGLRCSLTAGMHNAKGERTPVQDCFSTSEKAEGSSLCIKSVLFGFCCRLPPSLLEVTIRFYWTVTYLNKI